MRRLIEKTQMLIEGKREGGNRGWCLLSSMDMKVEQISGEIKWRIGIDGETAEMGHNFILASKINADKIAATVLQNAISSEESYDQSDKGYSKLRHTSSIKVHFGS